MATVVSLFDNPAAAATAGKPPVEELPHVEVAESAVLGALLANNNTFEQVGSFLRPEHFYHGVNGRIYGEIARRILATQKVDAVTLKLWLQEDPDIAVASGGPGAPTYLASLLTAMVGHHIKDYAEAIKDCWTRRQLIDISTKLKTGAYDHNKSVDGHVIDITSRLDAAVVGGREDMSLCSFDDAIHDAVQHARRAHEIKGHGGLLIPGFPKVSHAIALLPGEFTVLGGISGAGKSGLGWQFIINIAREMRESGLPVEETGGILGFSLEMRKGLLGIRALSAASGVPAEDILHGRTTPYQMERVEAAQVELRGLPIRLVDGGGLTPTMMRMRFAQALRAFRGKLALAIVDHLNLVDPGETAMRLGMGAATGRVADGVLFQCKHFQVPMLGLVQLNLKDIASRKDKRPTDADLRWSGNWQQNADHILFVHRPIQWEPKSPPTHPEELEPWEAYHERVRLYHERQKLLEPKAELIVSKVRMGRAGFSIPLLFDGRTTSFSEDPSV